MTAADSSSQNPTRTLRPVEFSDGTKLFVEVVDSTDEDLPQDISLLDPLDNIKKAIDKIGGTIIESLKRMASQQYSIELAFGLKGNMTLVPVLLNGSSEGSIKIKMSWKQPDARQ